MLDISLIKHLFGGKDEPAASYPEKRAVQKVFEDIMKNLTDRIGNNDHTCCSDQIIDESSGKYRADGENCIYAKCKQGKAENVNDGIFDAEPCLITADFTHSHCV